MVSETGNGVADDPVTSDDTNSTLRRVRRRLLKLLTGGSTALFLDPVHAMGAETPTSRTSPCLATFAAFHCLSPGTVRPEGWLRLYLGKQARELAAHLPEISWPFTGNYWSGEESPPEALGWWPWEQKAYWIDGAVRCALVLQNEEPLNRALGAVDFTLQHVLPDGYLGPAFARDARDPDPAQDNFRWPHTVFFRALAAYGDATKNGKVAAAVRRHYLADATRVSYGGPSRNVTNIEGMLWAYEHTGDVKLLGLAEKAWKSFLESVPAGDRESGDLHPDRVFANTPIHSHGVTYIEKAKLPAILYMHTGNLEYLRFALAAQERIFSHHMLIDGVPSTSEDYHETSALDAHETCDISDHIWSWGYLLMATGDGVWADRIERACFNAGLGAIRKDWKGVQYFSGPNQVIATHDSCPLDLAEENAESRMAYRPNPGHEAACCGANVHRLLPNYVIRMWMVPQTGGLAATLYGASTVRAHVGPDKELIEIIEDTDYPFQETISFTIRCGRATHFPLYLRVPGWCKAPRLTLNDQPLDVPPVHKGFIRLERTFRSGDRLSLSLPMHAALTFWPGNGVGVEHGPLVYALAINEAWSSSVVPKWSTPDYPEWDAKPSNSWSYGIGVAETEFLDYAQLQRRPMSGDPWIAPPVSMIVPMRKIPGWELRVDPKHPERRQTPPLPEVDSGLSKLLDKVEVEHLALVPYGATHLRLTIFSSAINWHP